MAIHIFSKTQASMYLIGALFALMAAACTAQQAGSTAVVAGDNLTQPRHLPANEEEAKTSSHLISLVDAQEAVPALSPASMTVCKLDDTKVYLVIDNQRRHIVDWDTFTNLGFKPEQIIACNEIAGYGEGAPITRLLKGSSELVYWMEGGFRRHIPDMRTFYSLGFQMKDISVVPDALLDLWPLGKPLPKAPGRLTALPAEECSIQQSRLPREITVTSEGWSDGPQRVSPNRRWLGFSSNPEGKARIYLVRTDGSSRIRIDAPDKRAPLTSPVWSPNGQYVAFINLYLSQPGGGQLYVAKADGTGVINLGVYVGYFDKIAWSPDSKQLAFTSGTAIGHGSGTNIVDYKVYTVNIAGSEPARLALDGCNPVWKR